MSIPTGFAKLRIAPQRESTAGARSSDDDDDDDAPRRRRDDSADIYSVTTRRPVPRAVKLRKYVTRTE